MTPREISDVLRQHADWFGGCGGSRADLRYADLRDAALSGSDLRSADLRSADLRDADLCYANLRGTDLSDADLRYADLRGADLSDADLSDADLRYADLRYADLRYADLSGADLRSADLCGADLCGTCLDPSAEIPWVSESDLVAAGLEVRGALVYGWRTALSQHVGSAAYTAGRCYRAPVFSVSDDGCHPGIYLAGEAWLRDEYPSTEIVRCFCRRDELHGAGDKWRCKRLWVCRDDVGVAP